MQHYQSFVEAEAINMDHNVESYMRDLQKNPLVDLTIANAEVQDVIERFRVYQAQTLEGVHGKTQKYYATYIQLINYYLMFERSIRTGDFELYCYVIAKINNVFFTFNQHNYARWLAWYNDALLNVEKTHPGLKEELMKGSFGIKRTDEPFSRVPIDLTLEQTINADAGRRLTGINHLTNSIAAPQRWSLNHGVRCSLISAVMEESGLASKQDVTNDLMDNRINKSKAQRDTFIAHLHERLNPFSSQLRPDALLNIATGQAAPDEVAEFLLNAESIGEDMRKNFIQHCSEDKENFQKFVVKRNKILNFASSTKKKKIRIAGKVQEVKLQRDLFGRLLGISLSSQETIDLDKVWFSRSSGNTIITHKLLFSRFYLFH